MSDGLGPQKERIDVHEKDMDIVGVGASLSYPVHSSIIQFWGW